MNVNEVNGGRECEWGQTLTIYFTACGCGFRDEFGGQSIEDACLSGWGLADSAASDAYGGPADAAIVLADGAMRPARQATDLLSRLRRSMV